MKLFRNRLLSLIESLMLLWNLEGGLIIVVELVS